MEKARALITSASFRNLLVEILHQRPDICVRLRLLGEMWSPHFTSVFFVTEKGIVLNDPVSRKFIAIHDLSSVMQFEIDHAFFGFQPHFHYEVQPLLTNKSAVVTQA
jgi:hypothetical protein